MAVAVTLGIAYAAAHAREVPRDHQVMAFYALALIAAISAVAFAYFRWRNLNLALMGWLMLYAIAAAYLSERTGGRVIRLAMLALIALAAEDVLVSSTGVIGKQLPRPVD